MARKDKKTPRRGDSTRFGTNRSAPGCVHPERRPFLEKEEGMHRRSAVLPFAVAVAAAALVLASPLTASANVPITLVSSDIYTNTSSYHKTQVEPDTFSFGSTIVSAFQSGRFIDGGASNIGWA